MSHPSSLKLITNFIESIYDELKLELPKNNNLTTNYTEQPNRSNRLINRMSYPAVYQLINQLINQSIVLPVIIFLLLKVLPWRDI